MSIGTIELPISPAHGARLLARAAARAGTLFTLGGLGSGNFGHAGRPGEVGGSAHDGGSRLDAEAEVGMKAIEGLLPSAVENAEYKNVAAESWEDLDTEDQNAAFYSYMNNQIDSVDVNTSYLDREITNELRQNNEKIIEQTEKDVLEVVASKFPHEDPSLPLEGQEAFAGYHQLDPDTLVYGDDDGEGAKLELGELRFQDGSSLTVEQQQVVEKWWDHQYKDNFQSVLHEEFESDSYYEKRNELEMEAINEGWQNLSDSEKFEYVDDKSSGHRLSPGEPDQWVTGITDGPNNEYSIRTRAIASELVRQRTDQILEERGVKASVDTNSLIEGVWDEWKGSSSNDSSLALQIATAKELGGVHRIEPVEVKRIEELMGPERMAQLQGYARAQWETTQFVMSKAEQDKVNVYRAIMLPSEDVDKAQVITVDRSGVEVGVPKEFGRDFDNFRAGSYAKLPDIALQRAGAQSTTADSGVANAWNGVGNRPSNATRVVVRIEAPATSVLSLPVYGKNIHEEHEVVLLGAPEPWSWDAWVSRAPEFRTIPITPIKPREKTPRLKAAGRKLVINLQEADANRPHWLSQARHDRQIARWRMQRWRMQRLRTAGGAGSGNFGHAGRPGEVGGSSASSVREADASIRGKAVEHAVVIMDGVEIGRYTSNDPSIIEIPDDLKMKDAVFTHNHPGNNSFSPQDIQLATNKNVLEMRAVTSDGTFAMRRLKDTWPIGTNGSYLSDAGLYAAAEQRTAWLQDIKEGRKTETWANAHHWDEVWKRVAAQWPADVHYSFEKAA